jgi:hypothetical protein
MRKPALFCFFLIAVVVIFSSTLAAGDGERRVALVVGNAAYRHTNTLANPRNDGADIAAALRKLGFEVIEGYDLDKAAMERTIWQFARQLAGARVGLFFYAGHGVQVDGRNYLVPVDARLEDDAGLDFEMVQLDLVHRTMKRATSTSLLFLDACRDNPLSRNLARALGTRSAAIGKGLAAVESGEGTLISFSTQPGYVAADGLPGQRNSPYAAALLNELGDPRDDLSTMLIAVRNQVIQATGRKQVPWEHSALTEPFSFLPPIAPRVVSGADGRREVASAAGSLLPVVMRAEPPAGTKRECPKYVPEVGLTVLTSCTEPPPPAGDEAVSTVAALAPPRPSVSAMPPPAKDGEDAARLHRQAEQGNERAMNDLGALYANGRGMAKDEGSAVRWFRRAAEKGDAKAISNLGSMYAEGRGVRKYEAEAVRLYRQAADKGEGMAMYNLGVMYEQGRGGLARNETEAARWTLAALKTGSEDVLKLVISDAPRGSAGFRRELQKRLREDGLYSGPIDGRFGVDMRKAIESLASRIRN